MKIRNGFVSNSSSTSFVIDKDDLTEFDMSKLKELFNKEIYDDNVLYESKNHFHGDLSLHDEEIRSFFKKLRARGIEIDEDE